MIKSQSKGWHFLYWWDDIFIVKSASQMSTQPILT